MPKKKQTVSDSAKTGTGALQADEEAAVSIPEKPREPAEKISDLSIASANTVPSTLPTIDEPQVAISISEELRKTAKEIVDLTAWIDGGDTFTVRGRLQSAERRSREILLEASEWPSAEALARGISFLGVAIIRATRDDVEGHLHRLEAFVSEQSPKKQEFTLLLRDRVWQYAEKSFEERSALREDLSDILADPLAYEQPKGGVAVAFIEHLLPTELRRIAEQVRHNWLNQFTLPTSSLDLIKAFIDVFGAGLVARAGDLTSSRAHPLETPILQGHLRLVEFARQLQRTTWTPASQPLVRFVINDGADGIIIYRDEQVVCAQNETGRDRRVLPTLLTLALFNQIPLCAKRFCMECFGEDKGAVARIRARECLIAAGMKEFQTKKRGSFNLVGVDFTHPCVSRNRLGEVLKKLWTDEAIAKAKDTPRWENPPEH